MKEMAGVPGSISHTAIGSESNSRVELLSKTPSTCTLEATAGIDISQSIHSSVRRFCSSASAIDTKTLGDLKVGSGKTSLKELWLDFESVLNSPVLHSGVEAADEGAFNGSSRGGDDGALGGIGSGESSMHLGLACAE